MIKKEKLNKYGIELIALDETFVKVKGYKNYFISNYGRLISQRKNKKSKDIELKLINPSVMADGYLGYTLSKPTRKYKGKYVKDKNGKNKDNRQGTTSHRLVATMFVEYNPYTEKYDYTLDQLAAHHKDHNRQNNYFKNLMWLANGKRGSRSDHSFVDSIKNIAIYDEKTAIYHTYKDIERLCKRIDIDILELIDILKDTDTPHIKDGKWETYKVNDYYVGLEKYKREPKK